MGTHRQILLVGKDQEGSITQLVLIQHALELLTSLNNTIAIIAVDDEDDTLGVLEVVPPQRTDLVLTTNIPNGEGNVLVLDSLDVEPWMADVRARIATLQTVCKQSIREDVLGAVQPTYQWWGWW